MIAERLRVVPTALDQPETAVAFGAYLVDLNAAGPNTRPAGQTPLPPAPPGPVPSGAAPRRVPRRVAFLGALSVVLVAAIVAVVVLASWGSTTASSSSGPNGQDGFHWSLKGSEAGLAEGLWAAPDSVVFGHWQGLTAYDPATGEKLWSHVLPETTFLCNMSPTVTASGLGAFTYGTINDAGGDECDNLQTISVASGELNWPEPVSLVDEDYTGRLGKIGGTSLSINGDLVTAAYAGSNSQAENPTDLIWVDTRTGKRLGLTNVGDEPLLHRCRLTGYAQAQRTEIIALSQCDHVTTPRMLMWSTDQPEWQLGAELEGCPELANGIDNAFMRSTGKDELLVGCYHSPSLERLYTVTDSFGERLVNLENVALEAVDTGGGAGSPPENMVLDDNTVYLPRGDGATSNGVIAAVDGSQPWQYTLRDTTEVRLMAAEGDEVTVLVVTPGPSTLYTVAGANEMTEAPELDQNVAEMLPDADQVVRVGDYLICAFDSTNMDDPAIGAVRLVK